jgi:hypothetical protein
LVGRDGAGYGFDLGQARRNIFLQLGLDSHPGDLLVGQTGRGAFADPAQYREGTGGLEAFAGDA